MALPPLLLAGIAVASLGLILHIVGIATPDWSTMSNIELGIFRACFGDKCGDIDEVSGELEAVRAMAILGVLAGCAGVGLALLFVILQFLRKSTMKLFILLSAGACFAAFVFIIIGIIIYGSELYDPLSSMYDLGYSFALCIVGAILIAAGGGLIFFGGKSLG